MNFTREEEENFIENLKFNMSLYERERSRLTGIQEMFNTPQEYENYTQNVIERHREKFIHHLQFRNRMAGLLKAIESTSSKDVYGVTSDYLQTLKSEYSADSSFVSSEISDKKRKEADNTVIDFLELALGTTKASGIFY